MNALKKVLFTALTFGLFGGVVFAQTGSPHEGDHGMRPPAITPDSMAMHQSNRMAKELNLTPEQLEKVEKINLDAAKKGAALRQEMLKERDAMQDRMKQNREDHQDALKEVLSEEQFRKFQEMHAPGSRHFRHEDRGHRKDFHRGRRGHPGDHRAPQPEDKGK